MVEIIVDWIGFGGINQDVSWFCIRDSSTPWRVWECIGRAKWCFRLLIYLYLPYHLECCLFCPYLYLIHMHLMMSCCLMKTTYWHGYQEYQRFSHRSLISRKFDKLNFIWYCVEEEIWTSTLIQLMLWSTNLSGMWNNGGRLFKYQSYGVIERLVKQ